MVAVFAVVIAETPVVDPYLLRTRACNFMLLFYVTTKHVWIM